MGFGFRVWYVLDSFFREMFDRRAQRGSFNSATGEVVALEGSTVWFHELRHKKQWEDGLLSFMSDRLWPATYYTGMLLFLLSLPYGYERVFLTLGIVFTPITLMMLFLEADAYLHGFKDWFGVKWAEARFVDETPSISAKAFIR